MLRAFAVEQETLLAGAAGGRSGAVVVPDRKQLVSRACLRIDQQTGGGIPGST